MGGVVKNIACYSLLLARPTKTTMKRSIVDHAYDYVSSPKLPFIRKVCKPQSKESTMNCSPPTTTTKVDDVITSFLDDTEQLPLVISPRFDDSLEFISRWLVDNRSFVEEQMLEHGAVLIRGFRIVSPPDFERTIKSLQPNLCAGKPFVPSALASTGRFR